MRAFFLVLLLLLGSLEATAHAEVAPSATLEAKSQAQRFFQAGVSLQKTEDFEAAIAAYETSLQLFATKSALFNLANCQRAAHRYADAWNSLHRLQVEFGAELVEPMSSTSLAQLEELENLTGLLTVETQPAGAAVTLDGKPIGVTPWATPHRVTIGRHVVHVALDGYTQKDNTIQITPKQSVALVIELDVATTEPPTQPATPTPSEPNVASQPSPEVRVTTAPTTSTQPVNGHEGGPGSTWRTVGWVGMGLGVVGVAAGARVGMLALDVDERLSAICEGGHCARGAAANIDRLDRLTTSANLFIGVGAALMVTGATLVLWPSTADAPERVQVTLSPNAIRIGGTF